MLETRPALHTVLGLFAAFFRDNIKRVAISGITLPGVVLVGGLGEPNTVCKTHTAISLLVRSRSVRFTFIVVFETATYSPGRRFICTYVILS